VDRVAQEADEVADQAPILAQRDVHQAAQFLHLKVMRVVRVQRELLEPVQAQFLVMQGQQGLEFFQPSGERFWLRGDHG